MNIRTKLVTGALCAMMTASLAACGAAPADMPDSTVKNQYGYANGEVYNGSRVYRPETEAKDELRRDTRDLMEDTRRATGEVGRDLERGVKHAGQSAEQAGRDVRRDVRDAGRRAESNFDRMKENGHITNDTRPRMQARKEAERHRAQDRNIHPSEERNIH